MCLSIRESIKNGDCPPPHVFCVAERAYRQMTLNNKDQSILITGESGAGKTESTKKVIHYLASLNSEKQSCEEPPHEIGARILNLNPVLEAFGNAQTVKNGNSSRFGKFIKLLFNHQGTLVGASLEQYLLEKSRLTKISSGEKTFHVFYLLLLGGSKEFKEKFGFLNSDVFRVINDEVLTENENITLQDEFHSLCSSMKTVGFSCQEIEDIFRIIAGIAFLLNLRFQEIRGKVDFSEDDTTQRTLAQVYHLFRVQDPEAFKMAILHPQLKAGKEMIKQDRTPIQLQASIDSISRTIYERLFGYLVKKLNQFLSVGPKCALSEHRWIGILDIAGFEIFPVNSFEQLCINYTNEKLQQFFNHTMFVKEQEIYRSEGLSDWNFLDFGLDLQPTIDLIEKSQASRSGILPLLDEDCIMPNSSDVTFARKLSINWKGASPFFEPSKFNDGKFFLHHYAGKVEYSTIGWIDKNKDPLNDTLVNELSLSDCRLLSQMFPKETEGHGSLFRTVSQKYREQLSLLMAELSKTEPHFVRCLLPNSKKRPMVIEPSLVIEQLTCNGVIEGLRICRRGYPNRLDFLTFKTQYGFLCKDTLDSSASLKEQCGALAASLCHSSHYRLGRTKLFFKIGVLAELEHRRDLLLRRIFKNLFAVWRSVVAKNFLMRDKLIQEEFCGMKDAIKDLIPSKSFGWLFLHRKLLPLLSISRQEGEIMALKSSVAKLEDILLKTQEDSCVREEKLSELESKLATYEEMFHSERSEKIELESTVKSLTFQLSEATNDRQAYLFKLEDQSNEFVKVRNACLEFETSLAASESKIHQLSSENQTLVADKANLKLLCDDSYARSESLESQISTLTSRVKDLDDLISSKDELLSRLTNNNSLLELKILDLTEANATLSSNLADVEAMNKNLENSNLKQDKRLQDATAELSVALNTLADKEKELEAEKSSLSHYKQALQEASDRSSILLNSSQSQQVKITEQESIIAGLNDQIETLKGLVNIKESSDEQLRKEFDILSFEILESKQASAIQKANFESELDLRLKKIEDLEAKLASANIDLQLKVSSLEESHFQCETLSKRLTEFEAEKVELEREFEEANIRHKSVIAKHDALLSAHAELEASQRSLHSKHLENCRELESKAMHLESLTSDLTCSRNSVSNLEKLNATLTESNDKLFEQLREERQKSTEANKNNHLALLQSQESIGQLSSELALKEAELRSLKNEVSLLSTANEKTVNDLKEHVKGLESYKLQLMCQLEDARFAFNRTTVDNSKLLKEVSLIEEKLATTEHDLQKIKSHTKELEEEKLSRGKELKEIQTSYESLKINFAALTNSKDLLLQENKKLKELLHDDERLANENEKIDSTLSLRLSELEENHARLIEERNSLEAAVTALQSELAEVNARSKSEMSEERKHFQSLRNSLEDQVAALQNDLKNYQDSALSSLQETRSFEAQIKAGTRERQELHELYENLRKTSQSDKQELADLRAKLLLLNADLQQFEATKDRADQEYHTLLSVKEALEASNECQRLQIGTLNAEIIGLKTSLSELEMTMTENKEEWEKELSKMHNLNLKILESEKKIFELSALETAREPERVRLMATIDEQSNDIQKKTALIETLEESLTGLQKEILSQAGTLTEYENENRRILLDLSIISSHLDTSRLENEALKNEHEFLVSEQEEHQRKNLEITGHLLSLQSKHASLMEKFASMYESVGKLHGDLETSQDMILQVQKKVGDEMAKNYELEVKLKDLELMLLRYKFGLKEQEPLSPEDMVSLSCSIVISPSSQQPNSSRVSLTSPGQSALISPTKNMHRSSLILNNASRLSLSHSLPGSPIHNGRAATVLSRGSPGLTVDTENLHPNSNAAACLTHLLKSFSEVSQVSANEKLQYIKSLNQAEHIQLDLKHQLEQKEALVIKLDSHVQSLQAQVDDLKAKQQLAAGGTLDIRNFLFTPRRFSEDIEVLEGGLFASPKMVSGTDASSTSTASRPQPEIETS